MSQRKSVHKAPSYKRRLEKRAADRDAAAAQGNEAMEAEK